MATNTKNSETLAKEPASTVEDLFSVGLELFSAGKLAEASKVFEEVQTQAVASGRLNLGRSARGYMTAIRTRVTNVAEGEVPDAPEMAIQVLLNLQDPTAALDIIEKILPASPERAILHYLKAMALAQMDQAQASAESLTQAVNLDADFLYQFRLESDFDGMRNQPAFATLLKG